MPINLTPVEFVREDANAIARDNGGSDRFDELRARAWRILVLEEPCLLRSGHKVLGRGKAEEQCGHNE